MHDLTEIIHRNEKRAAEMTAAALTGPHGRPMPTAHMPRNDNRDREPFSLDFNEFVRHMARECWPDGYRVVSGYNPGSLVQLRHDVNDANDILTVDADNSDGTIFGDPTVNHAFRAWHDWCHLADGWEFTPRGKAGAAYMQKRHVRKRVQFPVLAEFFCDLIDCEVNGRAQYFEAYGELPHDQRAFARTWLTEGEVAALNRKH